MRHIDELRGSLGEPTKDTRLNLQSVLGGGALSDAQRWMVAVASAIATRHPALREAVTRDARAAVGDEVLEDAVAAASLMAMNNVYYRFRHFVGKPSYGQKPARLRMNRLVKPAGSRVDFELACLAVSAINGCEACVRSHEAVVIGGGLTEDQVHDAVRIAAVLQATAVALEASSLPEAAHQAA